MTAPPPTAAPRTVAPSGRREYTLALLVLVVGAALVLVSTGATWGTVSISVPGLAAVTLEVTGREAAAEVAAAGLLALAGVAGLLATGRVGRVLVGVLLVLAGLVTVAGACGFARSADAVLAAVAADRIGVEGGAATAATRWWVLAVAGGSVVVVVGLWAVLRGGRWPRLGSRYERSPAAPGTTAAPAAAGLPGPPGDSSDVPVDAPPVDAAGTWAALDRGEDPTV